MNNPALPGWNFLHVIARYNLWRIYNTTGIPTKRGSFISSNRDHVITTLEMIHMWRPWKLSNFQDPPPPLSIYFQNSSTPLALDVQFQTKPPLQMITNQLKENIIQGWLLRVIRPFLQVGFRFQYQLINLIWLSLDFFSFRWFT